LFAEYDSGELDSCNSNGNPALFVGNNLAPGNNGFAKDARRFLKGDAVLLPVDEVFVWVIVDP
jgi:hypothetical protein